VCLSPHGYSISLSLAWEYSATDSTILRKSYSTGIYFSRLFIAKQRRQGHTLNFFSIVAPLFLSPLLRRKIRKKFLSFNALVLNC